MQIKEFSRLTGVSVRTLHYYDEIGLLKPAFVDEQSGYRFYDKHSLERMQEILFYRELDFSLKNISEILSSPNYDKKLALARQKQLLILKKNRLERLISALESAEKGEKSMSINLFDNSEFESAREKYSSEVREKWGDTQAFHESEQKTAHYSKEKWIEVNSEMSKLIAEFAELMKSGAKPSDVQIQKLVKKWQSFITENYYFCTDEILSGLGKMYVCDERFKKNIDKCGEGTAEFMSKAIENYCIS